MIEKELYGMRRDYSPKPLNIEDIDKNPFVQFDFWFREAAEFEDTEANAMVLSTVGKEMMPSSRMVLLKKYSKSGFVFFSNYKSHKGNHLDENNKAALLFFWPNTMRQVRIEGSVKKIAPSESEEYFKSRPRESMSSSALSSQSRELPSREIFDTDVKRLSESVQEIERPEHWGGYIVEPVLFEFWQGGINRAHDRFRFTGKGSRWNAVRLYP
jgi:pyridoxamine 5'-phosphate oxidase